MGCVRSRAISTGFEVLDHWAFGSGSPIYFHLRMWSWVLQLKQTGFAAVAVWGRKTFWSLLDGSLSVRVLQASFSAPLAFEISVQFLNWNRPPKARSTQAGPPA
jgi:hypothetical protein